MDDIWNILGIEPSRDEAVIKKAYAQRTHQYHPEENPEMFLRLRKAYQAALAYCDSTGEDIHYQEREYFPEPEHTPENFPEPEYTPEKQLPEKDSIFENQNEDNIREKEDQQGDIGWQIVAEEQEQESNPYIEHDAHKQFLTLYTGKQRGNPKLWMDYFTSSAFLEVHREPAFTALLLEDVEQQEQDNPPNREFLTWLHIAYQFTSSET
ncbi:MAG: J domain-containing protein, partial [Lachnospiraceae bacterium]|nr:J domain-containing protein [Lachnospiraceae bacterium]